MGKYEPIIRIAELGNLTRAAEALGYSQSSLSYITTSMEKKLGVKLFHRERQGVTLTEAGVPLLEIMKRIEDLENQLQTTALARRTNFLRIGTLTSMSIAWLPELMHTFNELHPDTTMHVLQRDSYSELQQGLKREDFDCTFFVGSYSSAFDFLPLYDDPYYVVMVPDHPLAHKAAIQPQDLEHYPLIPPSESFAHSPLADLYQKLTNRCTFFTNLAEDSTVLKMVEEGFGYSILPGLLLSDLAQGRNVVMRPFDPPLHRTIGLLCRPHDELGEATRAFLRLTRDHVEKWKASREQVS